MERERGGGGKLIALFQQQWPVLDAAAETAQVDVIERVAAEGPTRLCVVTAQSAVG